jgi:hypothetical protein
MRGEIRHSKHGTGRLARGARAIGIAGLSLALALFAGCETAQQRVQEHEDQLAAAGFLVKPANTPERQQMLARLPPHQFVQRVHGDSVNYVYADPLVCNCLYVGSQQAYNQYKRDRQQRQLADEQLMTAQTYQDASWNWGAWGPWNPGYGFWYGGGLGW